MGLVLVLLGLALASAQDGNSTQDPLTGSDTPKTQYPTGHEKPIGDMKSSHSYLSTHPPNLVYLIAVDLHRKVKAFRERNDTFIGENDFEMMLVKGIEPNLVDLPLERFSRIKGPFSGLRANQFGLDDKDPLWLLAKSWETVMLQADANLTSLSTVRFVHETLPKNRALGGVEFFKQNPSDFISAYAAKKKTGCGCDVNRNSIGCACCFYWAKMNVVICAGCGYIFKEFKFIVRINVQDYTIFSYEKEFAQSAFLKRLALFSKAVCIPYQFSSAFTVCLQLSIGFTPSFNKTIPSKIFACPSLIGQIVLVYDFTLLDLPCWELDFNLPFLRIGNGGQARLAYEGNRKSLKEPVKTMYASAQIRDVERVLNEMGKLEKRDDLEFARQHPTDKVKTVEYIGGTRKVLKKGTPTVPINWEPVDVQNLKYMVVLYTQPLPRPITNNDTDVSELARFGDMLDASLEQRYEDQSHVSLKVKASLGKSCGGVILAPDKVLTLCACVKFFYLYHMYKRKPSPEQYQDLFTLVSADIYVTYADLKFNADQIVYELDQNPDSFMKNSRCFDAIDNNIKKTDLSSINLLHMHMVVMPITTEFKHFEKLTLVPWKEMGAKQQMTKVDMALIGMKKTNPMDIFGKDGYELDPMYETVRFPLVSCRLTDFCSKAIRPFGASRKDKTKPKGFEENTQCFCALDKKFQLCDGAVGFPVMLQAGENSKQLIGLNTLPVQCKAEGSMLTALLSKSMITEIKDYLSGRDRKKKKKTTSRRPTPKNASSVRAPYMLLPLILSLIAH